MAIQEVIKYEGDNDILIYKHPAEDFNTLSQLIVHESQEAVFFSDGQALDSFKACTIGSIGATPTPPPAQTTVPKFSM